MKKLLPFLFLGILVAAGSCTKCYNCSKTNVIQVNGVDSVQTYQFDACKDGKEGNGQNNEDAVKEAEANGYTCTAK